jgi:hypothetical protein
MPDEGAPLDVLPSPPAVPPDAVAAATCGGCGAPLAADQRYCLACGRPCSPVRLAFLDVLQSEHAAAPTAVMGALPPRLPAPVGAGYVPPAEPAGTLASLRRYSGLFGLLGVLLVSLLIGLLVGHWLTGGAGGGGPIKQVLEVKGFGPLAAAPSTSAGGGAGSGGTSGSGSGSSSPSSSGHHGSSGSSHSGSSHSSVAHSEGGVEESASEEAEAAKEVKTTKPLAAARQLSSKTAHTTGKQHAKEIKEQGAAPLETH